MFLTSENAENINDTVFLLLNAPAHASTAMLSFGIVCATWLILIYPLALLVYWFSFNRDKQQAALSALLTSLIALTLNVIIGDFFPHPRPFMVPIGHTFISHVADASFPSDHMTLACAITMSLLFSQRQISGAVLLVMSGFIAWGRIYMGVHFPGDMLGSVLVALGCAFAVNKAEPLLTPLFDKLCNLHTYLLGYLKLTRVKH